MRSKKKPSIGIAALVLTVELLIRRFGLGGGSEGKDDGDQASWKSQYALSSPKLNRRVMAHF